MRIETVLLIVLSVSVVGCYGPGGGGKKGEDRPLLASPPGVNSDAAIHNDEGVMHARQGRLQEAARHFREALEIDDNFAEAHFNLGHVLDLLEDHNGAMNHFSRAEDLAGSSPNKEHILNDRVLQDHL